jgi:hypothetical protein
MLEKRSKKQPSGSSIDKQRQLIRDDVDPGEGRKIS